LAPAGGPLLGIGLGLGAFDLIGGFSFSSSSGSSGGSGLWSPSRTIISPGQGSTLESELMGKGPPDKNPDYDWKKFPGRRPEVRPTPTVRGEFKSKRIPLAICGALALGVGLGVTTVFGTQEADQQTSDRGGGTGAALWAVFLATTGGTFAVCASL